jgi:hypothetical protein
MQKEDRGDFMVVNNENRAESNLQYIDMDDTDIAIDIAIEL